MKLPWTKILRDAVLAAAAGALLLLIFRLHPVWWLVWIAPAPLLVIALRMRASEARWIVMVAALIGASCNFHYFRLVMPLTAVLASIAAQTLLWVFLIFATRRVVVRYRAWWTVFVFPALVVAIDTLMAALLPDGNWGSLAYSQGDQLPILQIASLFGVSGLLFLLMLVPSTLALAIAYGRNLHRGSIAYALTPLLLAAALFYGYVRLHRPVTGVETTFGMVSIDDPIGLRASASYASNILDEYGQRVAQLAGQGAQVIIFPEKIEMIAPEKVAERQQAFATLARQNHVWLEVGIGVDDSKGPTNWAWLFTPEGALARSYQKHHMAPPERIDHYVSGTNYSLQSVDGQNYGLAVCKDMHFAAFGRAYGQRGAAVMLVPAWDFGYLDGWLEARTTLLRGVENGYSVIRAAREGMLTASDPYGRVVAEAPSSAMPGSSLLAKVTVTDQVPTLYTHIGNIFGWICVAAAVVFLAIGRTPASRQID